MIDAPKERKALDPNSKRILAVEVVTWGKTIITADVMEIKATSDRWLHTVLARKVQFARAHVGTEQITKELYFLQLTVAEMYKLGLRPIEKYEVGMFPKLHLKAEQERYKATLRSAIETAPEPETEKIGSIPI